MPSYSSIIRILRIAVPAIGALLLILFFLWPTITRIRLPHIDKAEIHGDRTELINPRYEGKEKDGQRYVLTAERAIQVRADADHLTLISPTAALEKPDNALGSKVSAQRGIYDSKAQFLNLNDNVKLVTPQGDVFNTTTADVDLKTKTVTSHDAISGNSPRFDMTAHGFTYDDLHGLLTLAGPAKLTLYGNAHEPPINPSAAPATSGTGTN